MIATAYDHGDDKPSVGLTLDQMRAALLDPAGTLWIDLRSPTTDEWNAVMTGVLGLTAQQAEVLGGGLVDNRTESDSGAAEPQHSPVRSNWVGLSGGEVAGREALRIALPDGDADHAATAGELALLLGPNHLVTWHAGAPCVIEELERAATSTECLRRGADYVVIRCIAAALDRHAAALALLEARGHAVEEHVARLEADSVIGEALEVGGGASKIRGDMQSLSSALDELVSRPSAALRDANRVYYQAAGDRARRIAADSQGLERSMDRALAASGVVVRAHRWSTLLALAALGMAALAMAMLVWFVVLQQ